MDSTVHHSTHDTSLSLARVIPDASASCIAIAIGFRDVLADAVKEAIGIVLGGIETLVRTVQPFLVPSSAIP